MSDIGRDFPLLRESSKVSWDGGVDIYSEINENGQELFVQSKYKIRTKDDIDNCISKFENFTSNQKPRREKSLFDIIDSKNNKPIFAIITTSVAKRILSRYEDSALSSRKFYDTLVADGRIKIIDGTEIFTVLRTMYERLRSSICIKLDSVGGWAKTENVHLGIVSGEDVRQLYTDFGEALFFENIRNFILKKGDVADAEPSPVNAEVISSINDSPENFLSRNNGITFKATKVSLSEDNLLILEDAGIVNGCQTTVCLVRAGEASNRCKVAVKVVETSEAWDITKSANNQNEVARIDLELAKYLRPQLVARTATDYGHKIGGALALGAEDLISSIYSSEIDYDEMKALYIAIFSNKPRNIFDAIYSDVRFAEIGKVYDITGGEGKVFDVMFSFISEIRKAINKCELQFSGKEYATLFRRIFNDDKPRYRVYLGLLAISATIEVDISSRDNDPKRWVNQTSGYLVKMKEAIENNRPDIMRNYLRAFQVIAMASLEKDEKEIKQYLYNEFRKPFTAWYRKVLIQRDGDLAAT